MALPASPPINLQQICTEFSLPTTTPLASLLRGGGLIPNHVGTAGVPTSLPISLLDFLGAYAAQVIIATPRFIQSVVSGVTATVGYEWRASATYEMEQGGYMPLDNPWLQSGAAADYQVRWTTTAGGLSGGSAAVGTWLTCNATHLWRCARASIGTAGCTGTVEVRRVSDSVIIATAIIDLFAERE